MTRLATDFSPKGRPSDAIIIGGGIAGCTLAYELAARGVKVALLEQNAVAAESSGRNTGTLLSGPQKEVVELLDGRLVVQVHRSSPFAGDNSIIPPSRASVKPSSCPASG